MLRVLPWLILPVAAEEACRARVAHCIVGHVRTFWQEAVYQSIADVLVPRASPPHCADFFYVLSLSSNSDTSKGGLYEYNETLLWSTAWKILPPTKYLFDPPAPNPKHSSYHQPDCLFQCVHMFDKVRLCMDLVRKHESESGKTYQWILRSRPDLLWQDETVLPPLHELADTHIYMPITREHMKDTVCKDPVQIVPRNLADVFFDNIMDKCLLRRDMQGGVWNCDQWIRRFCESKGIPFTLLKLLGQIPFIPFLSFCCFFSLFSVFLVVTLCVFFSMIRNIFFRNNPRLAAVIKRLPNIKDDFFDYHDQWFQHIQFAQQLFPDSIHILGNEDEKLVVEHEKKWSDDSRAIPDGLEPKEGCKTVADSQFCMPSNAYLFLVQTFFLMF